ncbi:zinc-dependent alcohol dehydrogenase family protein [Acidisoma silvae]|uniref:NAD(P)-dependent alcohol dehydrogenase n=1 Tax=Acidisoma silvae TaxID=2802396 RepID=A0A964E1K3_9PROT|nr:NAD(P)-dependent alcohol dehydrogenase [Acidisoma silvae]MCB8877863.1 NAD(P)-dependent alcohol dehydrogenase [Acidisoma silvae]
MWIDSHEIGDFQEEMFGEYIAPQARQSSIEFAFPNGMEVLMTGMMRAWQIAAEGSEHLTLARRPLPIPGKGEVLIRVGAVSLNYRDKLVLEGSLLPEIPSLPFIPASDMAGDVIGIGQDVSRFKIGDRVTSQFWTTWTDGPAPADLGRYGLGGPLPGVLAEYVVLREDSILLTASTLSNVEAATLPIAYLTAWFALMEGTPLQRGQTVIVQGTGGVSLAGLQIAQAAGARVILTTRGTAKRERAMALGAWRVIDTSQTPNWADCVLAATDGHGADLILEVIGGDNLSQSITAAADGGVIGIIGFLESRDSGVPLLPLMMKHIRLQGITVGHRRAFERLTHFIDTHTIKPIIDRIYEFDDAVNAFSHLDEGPFGKIVIKVRS